jgi:heptosyltransferase-2
MATPALRALRKLAGEDGKLIGVVRPYVADVLQGTALVDSQICYDKPPRFRFANRETYLALREARLDCALLFTNSARTAWIARFSGARKRIGFGGQGRRLLLTDIVHRPSQLPTLDSYLYLAETLGCSTRSLQMELGTCAADETLADEVWRRLALPPGEQVVVLNSGGAFGAAKHWPAEHFAELARRVVSETDLSVLVNCGPAEREIAREIAARAASPRVVSLADFEPLPIGLAKACLRRARLLVTTDSGPRFIAIAFKRPVVTLFGPTDPAATVTHYANERCLSLSLDCQPCVAPTCPLKHHQCMRELSVNRVWGAVKELLARKDRAVA